MRRWAGVTWCDVTRGGRVVGLAAPVDTAAPWRLVDEADTPLTVCPEALLYLRVDEADGRLAAIAQGQSGIAHLWVEDVGWREAGPTHGQHCVEVVGTLAGWVVWIQRAPDAASAWVVARDGVVSSQRENAMPWSSQGFLDATAPGLLLTDAARRIGDVVLPQAAGPYLVGQYPVDPPRLVLATPEGQVRRVLAEAVVHEPRAAYLPDGTVVACARSDASGAVIVRPQPEANTTPARNPRRSALRTASRRSRAGPCRP